MEKIINNLIPNAEDFNIYEENEVKRYIKSKDNQKKMRELKKIRTKQITKEEKIKNEKRKEKEKKKEKKRDLKNKRKRNGTI